MPNPFKYGGIVTGKDFADRKNEVAYLMKELTSGQNILLYSPRRYGKSSLMMVVLEQLQRKGTMTVFIDLYGCASEADLVGKLVEKTVVPVYDTVDKIVSFFKSAFSGFRPEITVSTDGSVKISYSKESPILAEKEMSEVLDAPEKLARAKGKRLVIIFDEFQEIRRLDGNRLENLMRSSFQHHKLTTYVFMGSKQHIVEQMFESADRPFYKFAKPFPLGKIPIVEFKHFVLRKFKETEITVDPSVVDSVLTFTDGHPYFTQQLCHEIWSLAYERNSVKPSDIQDAIESILSIHNDLFFRTWDSLTLPQRRLLFALSRESMASSIYSVPWIKKYGLVSASHVKRAVKQLVKIGTVQRVNGGYCVDDIFFREWIKAKSLS